MRDRIPQTIFTVGLLVLVFLLLAVPQRRRLSYNPNTEIKIEGTIQEIQNFYCPVSGGEGTHLAVATDAGPLQVHLAPRNFLNTQNWHFKPGDRVQIVGSTMTYGGKPAIVARTISRDGVTLAVREENGKPVWTN